MKEETTILEILSLRKITRMVMLLFKCNKKTFNNLKKATRIRKHIILGRSNQPYHYQDHVESHI